MLGMARKHQTCAKKVLGRSKAEVTRFADDPLRYLRQAHDPA
jgi:hypothetical protein